MRGLDSREQKANIEANFEEGATDASTNFPDDGDCPGGARPSAGFLRMPVRRGFDAGALQQFDRYSPDLPGDDLRPSAALDRADPNATSSAAWHVSVHPAAGAQSRNSAI